MMIGSVGWLCPKCGAVCSPYEQTCKACADKAISGFGTKTGWSGTITLGPISNIRYEGVNIMSGTVYAAPPKTDAQKLEEAQKALQAAKKKAVYWEKQWDKLFNNLQGFIEDFEVDDEDED